jgi:hypothetical protein
MVTREGQLAIGIDRRDDCRNGALPLPLRCHRSLFGETSRMEISGKRSSGSRRKSGVRAHKSKTHVGASINGVSLGQPLFLKSAKSLLKKAKYQELLGGYL